MMNPIEKAAETLQAVTHWNRQDPVYHCLIDTGALVARSHLVGSWVSLVYMSHGQHSFSGSLWGEYRVLCLVKGLLGCR